MPEDYREPPLSSQALEGPGVFSVLKQMTIEVQSRVLVAQLGQNGWNSGHVLQAERRRVSLEKPGISS